MSAVILAIIIYGLFQPPKIWSFVLRFVLYATAIFPFWLVAHKPVIVFFDTIISSIFNLFDIMLFISYNNTIYYQSFGIVVFSALVLASNWHKSKKHIVMIISGFVCFAIIIMLLRLSNVMLTAFSINVAAHVHIFLSIAQNFLIPFLLWMAAISFVFQKSPDKSRNRLRGKPSMAI